MMVSGDIWLYLSWKHLPQSDMQKKEHLKKSILTAEMSLGGKSDAVDTLLCKCVESVRYFNEISFIRSPRLHLFGRKNSNNVKNCNHYKNVIYSCDANLIFKHHHTSSVSHDSSEIILICWFAAQETIIITINIEYSCAGYIFDETNKFSQDIVMNRKFKRIFMNVYTVDLMYPCCGNLCKNTFASVWAVSVFYSLVYYRACEVRFRLFVFWTVSAEEGNTPVLLFW